MYCENKQYMSLLQHLNLDSRSCQVHKFWRDIEESGSPVPIYYEGQRRLRLSPGEREDRCVF